MALISSFLGKKDRSGKLGRFERLCRCPGTEVGTEAGTEDGTEDGTEADTETGTDAGTEAGTEGVTEDGADAGTDAGTEADTEADTGPTEYSIQCLICPMNLLNLGSSAPWNRGNPR